MYCKDHSIANNRRQHPDPKHAAAKSTVYGAHPGNRRRTHHSVLQEIDRLGRLGGLSHETVTNLKDSYSERIAQLDNLLHDLRLRGEDLSQSQSRFVKRKLLQLEKAVVCQRNLDGVISDEPMRLLLSELDEQMHSLDDAEA